MNATTDTRYLARRAAAEGYTVATVRAAAEWVEAQELDALQTGIQPGYGTVKTTAELAEDITRSAYYAGGYMYPGTDWGSFRKFQPVARSRPGDSTDAAPVEDVIYALRRLPLGAEVVCTASLGNGKRTDVYRREAIGFIHVAYSDEKEEADARATVRVTPEAVARKLGVAVSATLEEILHACFP